MPPESQPSNFIGSMVSIDCGQLGIYQGHVKKIDPVMNTLTITHAFHNGLRCDQSEVNLSSTTIHDIKIIHASNEAKEIITRKATPSKMTKEIDEVTKPVCSSPIKIIEATSKARNGNGFYNSGSNGHNSQSCRRKLSPPDSPSKLTDPTDGLLGPRPRMSKSREPPIQEALEHAHDDHASNGGSGSFKNWSNHQSSADHNRKSRSSRKGESNRRGANAKNSECFSAPTESYLQEEFDFELNLAMFNKKKVFQEIENGFPELSLEEEPVEQKYKHDENVLKSGVSDTTALKQIRVPEVKSQMYFTDNGIAVPSISLELRDKLCEAASLFGLSQARQLEAFGRAASEMVIHLIGGSHRIHPKNNHQMPSVVVLCGPHHHGALGVCCARILSSHGVQVTLFMPHVTMLPPSVADELELYRLSGSAITHNVQGLPDTIDLIVTAMDTPYDLTITKQPWYVSITKWFTSGDIRAQVLALDPPADGVGIPAKWSLCKVLPLTKVAATCGSLYLCDLSIPASIFKKSGITYVSPFGSKFIIPLHAKQ
ncbi:enhancer of mRNA-decapping protein 3-like [Biomphalaria glabrata]|uniref:Enhancer of mRNA-decapping protein 3 n=1 Tax=Biomphalaria glabrata TaxID=6526 RepID=A0A9W3AV20_BIOGL|nr:enhancer of mRNA-decapping protein 3-like [Biomphalaria glabrata]XP_013064885.2 enhancer of mRNA-decapping protein 3-like [Biomphalaria glabrata]XP_055890979.1 enhancer of mRNA-decapping protein 3-like [Biomphalaria glabrata]